MSTSFLIFIWYYSILQPHSIIHESLPFPIICLREGRRSKWLSNTDLSDILRLTVWLSSSSSTSSSFLKGHNEILQRWYNNRLPGGSRNHLRVHYYSMKIGKQFEMCQIHCTVLQLWGLYVLFEQEIWQWKKGFFQISFEIPFLVRSLKSSIVELG